MVAVLAHPPRPAMTHPDDRPSDQERPESGPPAPDVEIDPELVSWEQKDQFGCTGASRSDD